MLSYYEFFAGGGMARAGLGKAWRCAFANDFDAKKCASYAANWGEDALVVADVASLTTADLPGQADLAWASFPCQDLSLAGTCAGLRGARSGTFWKFWGLMKKLTTEGRGPRIIVLENVCGALTSHGGKDFTAIASALASANYRFGAVVVNAVRFLPQSRPRLFIVAVQDSIALPQSIVQDSASGLWYPDSLLEAYGRLSPRSKGKWVWWHLPTPPERKSTFADLIENRPSGVNWHTPAETQRLLDMMTPLNRGKVEAAQCTGGRSVGTIYKRTRVDENGVRHQRAEVRFDDIAGCLRTPVGGSSRQTILIVDAANVQSRLLSPREAARLMGLPDSYLLPKNYNDAYHLAGDGLAVPVVRFLAGHLLEPILASSVARRKKAA